MYSSMRVLVGKYRVLGYCRTTTAYWQEDRAGGVNMENRRPGEMKMWMNRGVWYWVSLVRY